MLNQKVAILPILFPIHSILAYSDKQDPPGPKEGVQVDNGPIADTDAPFLTMQLDSHL